MSRFRDWLRGLGLAAGDMAFVALLFGLYPILEPGESLVLPVFLWTALLAAQLLAGFLLLQREISVNFYLLGSLAAAILEGYLVASRGFCSAPTAFFYGFTGFLAAAVSAHAAGMVLWLPRLNWNLHYVDALIIVTAGYLALAHAAGRQPGTDTMAAAALALALNLFAVNRARTREEDVLIIQGAGAGGRLILAALAVLALVLTAAVTGLASGQVNSFVDFLLVILQALWKVAQAVVLVVVAIIAFFVFILAWIFPATHSAVNEKMESGAQELMEQAEGLGLVLPPWFWPALGIFLLTAVFVWCLWIFRGVRIKRPRRVAKRRKVVRKSRLRQALRQLLGRMVFAVKFEWQYFRGRDTAPGLLVYAERGGRLRRVGRRRGESAGAYLRRLSRMGNEPELERLAGTLEQAFYGAGARMEREECRQMRRALDRALAACSGKLKKSG